MEFRHSNKRTTYYDYDEKMHLSLNGNSAFWHSVQGGMHVEAVCRATALHSMLNENIPLCAPVCQKNLRGKWPCVIDPSEIQHAFHLLVFKKSLRVFIFF